MTRWVGASSQAPVSTCSSRSRRPQAIHCSKLANASWPTVGGRDGARRSIA